MDYKEALQHLENGEIKSCIDYFKNNHYELEYGYSLMLSNKLNDAKEIFANIQSIRADWANIIISIMQGTINKRPTYFQIRNFIEIDINLLFKVKLTKHIEYILGAAETFQEINSETCKFLGRVLLKNNCLNSAKYFLDKAVDYFYNDVELHFLFVEYYLECNDTINAQKALNNCLRISPEYYPAILMKKKFENSIKLQ